MSSVSDLVSVVVPAYNAARYLASTLRSAQTQSYPAIEIFVVDDGSTDETVQIATAAAAADPRVHVLRQANSGVAAARNAGIRASTGEFVAPLDADDLWHPDKLRLQVARMHEAGADVGVVYTDYEEVEAATERPLRAHPHDLPEGDLSEVFVYRNPIPCASIPLIRRACLNRAGGYDESMRVRDAQGCEDWDLYLRLSEHTRFSVVRTPLVTYRRVAGSMSTNPERMQASYEILMQRLRARRPGVPGALVRRSRRRFLLYLAGIYRQQGHAHTAFRYMARAAWADAGALVRDPPSVRALRRALRSLRR